MLLLVLVLKRYGYVQMGTNGLHKFVIESVAMDARLNKGKETLDITHPELVIEWHSSNKLKPCDVTCGSETNIIWVCSDGHTWPSTVKNRTTMRPNAWRET